MQFNHRLILASFTLCAIAACGRQGARASDFDSAAAAAEAATPGGIPADQPKVAHVMGFEFGHGLDRRNLIVGGAIAHYTPGDSILVSVRTTTAAADAPISVRLRFNNKTVDSTETKASAPDSTGIANMGVRFGPPAAKGAYQADVFLNGKYQMSKVFTVGP